jgi:hypothetical protein
VKLEGRYGLIDKNGRAITAPKYDTIGAFDQEVAEVSIGEQYGYINRIGN